MSPDARTIRTHWIDSLKAASPNAAKLFARLPVYVRKIAGILAVMNGEHEISEGALKAAIVWVEYAAATIDAVAATAQERRRTLTVSGDSEAILTALKDLGADAKPVSSSDVRRKTRLDKKRFDAAIGSLLQQAPSAIDLSSESWISGNGTKKERAMLALTREAAKSSAAPEDGDEIPF